MTDWVDLTAAMPLEKQLAFGVEFREIPMLRFCGDPFMCEVILDGRKTMLVGNPQQALHTYLGGRELSEALQ